MDWGFLNVSQSSMRTACAKRNKQGYLFEFQKYFCSVNEIFQAFSIPSSHLNSHLLPLTTFSLDVRSKVITLINVSAQNVLLKIQITALLKPAQPSRLC